MGFIMQNDEDFEKQDVQEKVKARFVELTQTTLQMTGKSYPNLSSIGEMIESEEFTYKELSLVNEMLPFLNEEGLDLLEREFEPFLKIVEDKCEQADVVWYDILTQLIFRKEAKQIKAYLEQNQKLN